MQYLLTKCLCALAIALTACGAVAQETTGPKAVPESKTGAGVIGTRLPLEDLRWLNTNEGEPVETKGRVTLVRWWTDTCPYCERSLPAISALEKKYSDRGFQTVAVYHPKPPPGRKEHNRPACSRTHRL